MTVSGVDPHYNSEKWHQHISELNKRGSLKFESEQRRKDGILIPVEIVSNYVLFGEKEYICAFVRDITERKKAEAKVQRLTHLYAALGQCNQAIVHCTNEEELFIQICRDAVLFGGLKMAWIGLVDEASQRVTPVASYGEGGDYLHDIQISVNADTPYGRGPTGTSIRENQPFWCQDFQQDPATAVWHERGKKYGWASSASLPLCKEGKPIGNLTLYTDTINAFDEDIRKLLIEMTLDISYALDGFARESKRREAEHALQVSEEKFRNIFENVQDAFYEITMDGIILDVSPSIEVISKGQYQRKDIIGKPFFDFYANPGERENFLEVLQNRGSVTDYEITFKNRDGSIIPCSISTKIQCDAQGKPVKIIGSLRDITERKRTEAALRESTELFSLFMRHSPVYTYIKVVTPTESRVLQASDNFKDMIGMPGVDMIGKTMADLFPAEFAAKITANDWETVSNGKVLRLDEDLRGRYYSTIKFPIIKGDQKMLAGFTIDITERKRAEEEKAKLEVQLQQVQKLESVGRLAGGVAHDFNNMLGVILGHTELALMQTSPSNPLHADLVEVQNAAQRSADLTRQLLAFARKQTVAPKVLDLNDTVAGMLKMLERLIGEDIGLVWIPGIDLGQVKIDPSQIDQILANLCVNAHDAIAGVGKVTIETANVMLDESYSTNHAGFIPGEYVRLSISDNGCGMDKVTLSQIFEPFFTTKEFGKGTGLGLATVYGIIKQNMGFVNVYSEPGAGTVFNIYLPRYVGKAAPAIPDSSMEPSQRGQGTILLVEDEPAILKMTRTILEKLGYTVLAAGSPGEAIRLAEEFGGKMDLLMTDVVMPEMNGHALAKKILSLYPNIQRLFMSGYTADVIAHQGVLDEGVHFIQKPFSMKDLAAKIHELLDGDND